MLAADWGGSSDTSIEFNWTLYTFYFNIEIPTETDIKFQITTPATIIELPFEILNVLSLSFTLLDSHNLIPSGLLASIDVE